jgi:NAD(P)-dependent dehydrogenase (short-subunit alcohol dehydrogenase family)
LLGRNAYTSSEAIRTIEARGVRVFCLKGDIADTQAMREVLARLAAEAPPVRGVVHAAAAFSAAPVGELDDASIASMLRPKI